MITATIWPRTWIRDAVLRGNGRVVSRRSCGRPVAGHLAQGPVQVHPRRGGPQVDAGLHHDPGVPWGPHPGHPF